MKTTILTAAVILGASVSFVSAADAQEFYAAPMNAGPPNMTMMTPTAPQPAPMAEPMASKPMMHHHMMKKHMMMKKKMMMKKDM